MKKKSLSFLHSVKPWLTIMLMVGVSFNVLGQTSFTFHSSTQTNKCLHCVSSLNGSGCLVGGDSGTILLWSNQNNWIKQQSGTTSDLLGINMKFISIGKMGTILSGGWGGSWQSRVSNTNRTLRSVVFAGGLFVAVGDSGLIITSTNDSIWTIQSSGITKGLRSVCHTVGYGNDGYFTAVGDSGTILTSPDGIAWSKQSSGTTKNLNAVASGNLFGGISIRGVKTVAIGDSGIILTSSDSGKTWNSQTSGTTNALWGIFCLVNSLNGDWLFYITVGAQGTILTSYTNVHFPTYGPPGVTWTPQTSGTTRNLYGVSWGYGDSLIAVGDSGTILTSYYRPVYTGIKQGRIIAKPQLISISNNFIFYTLSEPFLMSIKLYDTKGRLVKMLINRIQQPGSYSVAMPHDISPGIYTADIIIGKQKLDRTVVVSR